MLDSVLHQTESRVDDPADRVVAHGRAEVEAAVALVAVEPVAVVVVRVAGRRGGDRVADGWIGKSSNGVSTASPWVQSSATTPPLMLRSSGPAEHSLMAPPEAFGRPGSAVARRRR